LGPNIRANLLKNLHNKSLAEAAIAHLSTVPKAKGPNDVIARRKHQITYLANVAVAREELLAEQWSQNRHNKRMSSQKYGF
uniref:IS110 family transposase n=1 Tax=Dracunculus medinensis TaxID=318479 RepID=A0A0N4U884_DRAME